MRIEVCVQATRKCIVELTIDFFIHSTMLIYLTNHIQAPTVTNYNISITLKHLTSTRIKQLYA